jgi:hypothetical protein
MFTIFAKDNIGKEIDNTGDLFYYNGCLHFSTRQYPHHNATANPFTCCNADVHPVSQSEAFASRMQSKQRVVRSAAGRIEPIAS